MAAVAHPVGMRVRPAAHAAARAREDGGRVARGEGAREVPRLKVTRSRELALRDCRVRCGLALLPPARPTRRRRARGRWPRAPPSRPGGPRRCRCRRGGARCRPAKQRRGEQRCSIGSKRTLAWRRQHSSTASAGGGGRGRGVEGGGVPARWRPARCAAPSAGRKGSRGSGRRRAAAGPPSRLQRDAAELSDRLLAVAHGSDGSSSGSESRFAPLHSSPSGVSCCCTARSQPRSTPKSLGPSRHCTAPISEASAPPPLMSGTCKAVGTWPGPVRRAARHGSSHEQAAGRVRAAAAHHAAFALVEAPVGGQRGEVAGEPVARVPAGRRRRTIRPERAGQGHSRTDGPRSATHMRRVSASRAALHTRASSISPAKRSDGRPEESIPPMISGVRLSPPAWERGRAALEEAPGCA